MIGRAVLAGTAKLIPRLPPDGDKPSVLIPITSPAILNNEPPELPRLIAASVWMKLSKGPNRMSRFLAETIPAVTVPPRPDGLPIAMIWSESANFTTDNGVLG